MKWKTLSKTDAQKNMERWLERPPENYDPDYKELREDLINAMNSVVSELNIKLTDVRKVAYMFDLKFGLKIYMLLTEKYNMRIRDASDDGIWRYLSIMVIPDIVYSRWDLNPSRFWKISRRIWLKTLWWYIYLAWQGDCEKTFAILKGNTTDEIVQLVERSGSSGYRVELCRKIMAWYGELPNDRKNRSSQTFRRVLKLNTARVKVMEPALLPGGESQYIKELFDYFEQQ